MILPFRVRSVSESLAAFECFDAPGQCREPLAFDGYPPPQIRNIAGQRAEFSAVLLGYRGSLPTVCSTWS
jgi:hypothetical protein